MKRASLFAFFIRLLLFSYIYAFVFLNLLHVIGLTVTQQHLSSQHQFIRFSSSQKESTDT